MPISNITRNLRDGELIIKDGSNPAQTLTVLLDEGDLTWTQKQNTIEVKDRGSIAAGHTRKGDEESVSISFTAKWTQLVGASTPAADPLQLYEMLMFTNTANVVSTSAVGEQETLTLEFTILDPTGLASEKVTFEKVYRVSLTMSEGEDNNLIAYTAKAFQVAPTVSRV